MAHNLEGCIHSYMCSSRGAYHTATKARKDPVPSSDYTDFFERDSSQGTFKFIHADAPKSGSLVKKGLCSIACQVGRI